MLRKAMNRRPSEADRRGDFSQRVRGRLSGVTLFSKLPLDERQRHYVLVQLILRASIVMMGAFLFLMIVSTLAGNTYVMPRLLVGVGAIGYLGATIFLLERGFQKTATWLVILLFAMLALTLLVIWGITNAIGVLLLAFLIILTGAIAGMRALLPVTVGIIILIASIQLMTQLWAEYSGLSLYVKPSSFGDVIGLSLLFSMIALLSWASGRQINYSLERALVAEAALEQEKQLLSVRLEEKTHSLQKAQLEEVRQLYRFAEFGQLGTVVMHELANYLTALTLDMDDIEQQSHRSHAIDRARQSIRYLDTMVTQVRRRLSETSHTEVFSLRSLVDDVVAQVADKAQQHQVTMHVEYPQRGRFQYRGDGLRLSQVITILVTNAIEAYAEMPPAHGDRLVSITLTRSPHHYEITVLDAGVGMTIEQRDRLFEPFQSTKKNGMGIGLFIAKEVIERHFNGTIHHYNSEGKTRFVVKLPLTKAKRS